LTFRLLVCGRVRTSHSGRAPHCSRCVGRHSSAGPDPPSRPSLGRAICSGPSPGCPDSLSVQFKGRTLRAALLNLSMQSGGNDMCGIFRGRGTAVWWHCLPVEERSYCPRLPSREYPDGAVRREGGLRAQLGQHPPAWRGGCTWGTKEATSSSCVLETSLPKRRLTASTFLNQDKQILDG